MKMKRRPSTENNNQHSSTKTTEPRKETATISTIISGIRGVRGWTRFKRRGVPKFEFEPLTNSVEENIEKTKTKKVSDLLSGLLMLMALKDGRGRRRNRDRKEKSGGMHVKSSRPSQTRRGKKEKKSKRKRRDDDNDDIKGTKPNQTKNTTQRNETKRKRQRKPNGQLESGKPGSAQCRGATATPSTRPKRVHPSRVPAPPDPSAHQPIKSKIQTPA